nr:pilus assembly protein N-terminal domain-containing protein [Vibrio cholerae]
MQQCFYSILSLILLSSTAWCTELMNLDQGAATTINLKRQIDTVFVADNTVADYRIVDKNKVVVYGVGQGATSVIVYDRGGNEIYNSEVVVNQSLRLLKQTLIARFPDESISVSNVGEQVVLDGTVSSEVVKYKIYRLVGEMLKKNVSEVNSHVIETGENNREETLQYTATYVYDGVINNLKVLTTEQINVKLTIAEVSSSFLSELGVSYGDTGGGEVGKFYNKLLDFTAQDIVTIIATSGNDDIGQVLAEPNLSVISGETASFLVGGEIPLAIKEGDNYSIHYKEYGIKLSMVAKITDSENIRLSLQPEVSSLDSVNRSDNSSYNFPSLKTRKAQTTVQLKDGQSFVLGGLMTTEERESLRKIPIIGDIPILGALFSSTKSDRKKTELIIVATVNLVEPVKTEQVILPVFNKTSDLERLLRIDLTGVDEPELQRTINAGGFN